MAFQLFSYPDQLIREVWREWCETVLSTGVEAEFAVPTGFQLKLGSTTANDRSRALECYNLGLLKGLLVNPRDGARGELPLGWDLLVKEQSPISNLGYFSYAIGRGLKENPENLIIKSAFSSLCCILLLHLGTEKDSSNKKILWSSLALDLIEKYNLKYNTTDDLKKIRVFLAIVFSTIDKNGINQISDSIKQNRLPDHFFLVRGDLTTKLSQSKIYDIIVDDKFSTTDIKPAKDALYFVGTADSGFRGIFGQVLQSESKFMQLVANFELTNIRNEKTSPFESLFSFDPTSERLCSIKILNEIFTNTPCETEWNRIMKTLIDGVNEALNVLGFGNQVLNEKDKTNTHHSNGTYYVHGLMADSKIPETGTFELEVSLDNSSKPKIHDHIEISGIKYKIISLSEDNDKLKLHLNRYE